MTFNNLIIFPVIFLFLNTSPKLQVNDPADNFTEESRTIFLIKQRWHTGIIIERDKIDPALIPEINDFKSYRLIDFGWGDKEFYQIPGFDSGLAFEALFLKTPSAMRVNGINVSNQILFDYSEIVVAIELEAEQFTTLCRFIGDTFDRTTEQRIINEQAGGKIKYYEARGDYHLFNTCNTWVATGLKKAGFEIKDEVMLAEELFNEVAKIGVVITAK